MAYQVLARKWRPLSFEDVVNQEHVKTTLINAIQAKRIAHSYIFAGPRGVGKTTIARIVARAVSCEKGPTSTPCNTCTPCQEIIEDRSMDVMEIDGASNRGIEDIRNIRENVKYAPVHGKYRIYIIDEVHMLTREAFNALLKTLEEPPEHVMFIFATTEFQKIPATIISRCQRFDFKRIAIQEIVSQLQKICNAEKISVTEEALIFLSKRSDGSMRDAESLLDQLISFCGQSISADDVFDVLGMIREDIYFFCSEAMTSGKVSEGFSIARKIFDDGFDPGEFVNGLLEHFRNILITNISGNADMVDTSELFRKKYQEAAHNISDADILRVVNIIAEAEYSIKKSAQPLLRLEMLLTKLITLDRSVSIQQVLNAIDNEGNAKGVVTSNPKIVSADRQKSEQEPEKSGADPPTRDESVKKNDEYDHVETIAQKDMKAEIESESQSDSSGNGSQLNLTIIKERWSEFIDMALNESAVTGSYLKEGNPSSFEENVVQISFRPEYEFNIHSLKRNHTRVNKLLEKMFGPDIGFNCVIIELTEEEKKQSAKRLVQVSMEDKIKKIIEREPIIRSIIEQFGATPVRLVQE